MVRILCKRLVSEPESLEDGRRPVPSAWLSSEAGREERSILAPGLDSSQLADSSRQTRSGLKRPQLTSQSLYGSRYGSRYGLATVWVRCRYGVATVSL